MDLARTCDTGTDRVVVNVCLFWSLILLRSQHYACFYEIYRIDFLQIKKTVNSSATKSHARQNLWGKEKAT